MKAIIFGATGGTGLELVSQCLAAGHSTSAFVRTPSKLKGLTPSIITGDVKNAAQVEAALATPFDCVFIALGGSGIMAPDDTCSVGTKNILAALKKSAASPPPRLIVCSSMGVRNRGDISSFAAWLLKYPLADKDIQEADVAASGLPFVIVRPTGLRDSGSVGLQSLAVVPSGPTPTTSISRADVAAFMIAQATSDAHLSRAIGISWPKK
jgi:uncharacterized protein YbjT (DUF2867 family)